MILTKFVKVNIGSANYKHYKDKGYNVIMNNIIEVNVEDLPTNSHVKITVKCDRCGIEKQKMYQGYNIYTKNQTIPYYCNHCNTERIIESFKMRFGEGVTNSMHVEEYKNKQTINLKKSITKDVIDKRKNTCVEKYGTNTPCENDIIKEKLLLSIHNKTDVEKQKIIKKREQTLIEKYGVSNCNLVMGSIEKAKETRISKGIQVPDEKLTDYQKYRKIVVSMTNKIKRKLFENWDGYDFYDNEYIKDNFCLSKTDKKYPTIDHKTSILYGYLNNIDPSIISDIDNLCFTKLTNNSKKGSKNFLYL